MFSTTGVGSPFWKLKNSFHLEFCALRLQAEADDS